MPKVITREYDNSSAGIRVTNSFAVVVPGLCGTPKAGYDPAEVFDDNGIYECSSQVDFKNYVGQITGEIAPNSGEYATLYTDAGGQLPGTYKFTPFKRQLSYNSNLNQVFFTKDNTICGAIYTFAAAVSNTKQKNRAEVLEGSTLAYYDLTPVTSLDEIEFVNLYTKLTSTATYNATTEYYILDANENYVLDDTVTEDNFAAKVASEAGLYVENENAQTKYEYAVVAYDSETGLLKTGENPIYYATLGNQIAYQLLDLGYTVLYKKMDPDAINSATGSTTDEKIAKYLSEPEFWEPLKDKSLYDYRYLTTGGVYNAAVANAIINVAKFDNNVSLEDSQIYGDSNGRGDVIALVDIDETNILKNVTNQKKLLTAFKAETDKITSSAYAGIFAPRVIYALDDTVTAAYGGNCTFPASFEYLAAASLAFQKYAEWYAVAGPYRGFSPYTIKGTTIKCGAIMANTLAPRVKNTYANKGINLVVTDHGSFLLEGNRTAYPLNQSGLVYSHFLNVRQLCTTLKKRVDSACAQFKYDPNSDLLWINFYNIVDRTLKAMKGDQGVRSYKIKRVISTKKAVMMANIHISPIEAAEDFDISIYLEDTTSGTAATVVEE